MIKLIKIIASLFALTTPLFVAQAQDVAGKEEQKERNAFWSFDISSHSLAYDSENEEVAKGYGDSAILFGLSGGNRINDTLSWQIGLAFGTADGAVFSEKEIGGLTCQGVDSPDYETISGETEISDFSAGVVYGRKLEAKEKAPFFGIAYRNLAYNYNLAYKYTTAGECETLHSDSSVNLITVNLTGVELNAGYLFKINDKFGWNISYSHTLILSTTANDGEDDIEGIENPSNINTSFVFYF